MDKSYIKFGKEKEDFWIEPGKTLLKWNLDDVLLDDVSHWNSNLLRGGPLAAQTCEGTAPGERERAPERQLHGLPAGHLPPPAGLSLQTLDSLSKTQQTRSVVKQPGTRALLPHASSNTHRWGMFLRRKKDFHARKDFS